MEHAGALLVDPAGGRCWGTLLPGLQALLLDLAGLLVDQAGGIHWWIMRRSLLNLHVFQFSIDLL